MNVYDQLKSLGIALPAVATPAAAYVPFVKTGNLVFLSGHIAKKDGKAWTGQFGRNMTTEEGKAAARAIEPTLQPGDGGLIAVDKQGNLIDTKAKRNLTEERVEKLNAIGDAFNIDVRYSDYDELLKDPNIDAVHINSPIPNHAEQTLKALRAGKHVAQHVRCAATAVSVKDGEEVRVGDAAELGEALGVGDVEGLDELERGVLEGARALAASPSATRASARRRSGSAASSSGMSARPAARGLGRSWRPGRMHCRRSGG